MRSDIELQHLRVFEATYRLRNLTRAAIELELTQPALSKSLRALRERLSDPLFARTPRGMEPTSRADAMIEAVRRALRIVDVELRSAAEFDPATAARLFVLCCSDLGALHFVPRLLHHTTRHAPTLQFRVVAPFPDIASGLAEGEVDLAVGPFPDLGPGIFQQRLFSDNYVCVVSADHPRVRNDFTIDGFKRERHLVASIPGTGHAHNLVEQRIVEACGSARIAVRLPSFLPASFMLQGTEYVFTLTSTHARRFMRLGGLRMVPCPLPLPALEIRQYWHERVQNDPAHRWFRQLMYELFGEGSELAAADDDSA